MKIITLEGVCVLFFLQLILFTCILFFRVNNLVEQFVQGSCLDSGFNFIHILVFNVI